MDLIQKLKEAYSTRSPFTCPLYLSSMSQFYRKSTEGMRKRDWLALSNYLASIVLPPPPTSTFPQRLVSRAPPISFTVVEAIDGATSRFPDQHTRISDLVSSVYFSICSLAIFILLLGVLCASTPASQRQWKQWLRFLPFACPCTRLRLSSIGEKKRRTELIQRKIANYQEMKNELLNNSRGIFNEYY